MEQVVMMSMNVCLLAYAIRMRLAKTQSAVIHALVGAVSLEMDGLVMTSMNARQRLTAAQTQIVPTQWEVMCAFVESVSEGME